MKLTAGVDRERNCERDVVWVREILCVRKRVIVSVCMKESELCHCAYLCHVNDVSIFIDETIFK